MREKFASRARARHAEGPPQAFEARRPDGFIRRLVTMGLKAKR